MTRFTYENKICILKANLATWTSLPYLNSILKGGKKKKKKQLLASNSTNRWLKKKKKSEIIFLLLLISKAHVYINPQWGADGKCVWRAWSVFRSGAGSISIKLYRSTASQPPSPFQSTAESSAAWNPENTSLIETEITTGINRNYWGTQHLT